MVLFLNRRLKKKNNFFKDFKDSSSVSNVQIHSAYYGEDQARKPRFLQRVKNGSQFLVRHYLMLETGFFFSGMGGRNSSKSQTSDLLKGVSENGARAIY